MRTLIAALVVFGLAASVAAQSHDPEPKTAKDAPEAAAKPGSDHQAPAHGAESAPAGPVKKTPTVSSIVARPKPAPAGEDAAHGDASAHDGAAKPAGGHVATSGRAKASQGAREKGKPVVSGAAGVVHKAAPADDHGAAPAAHAPAAAAQHGAAKKPSAAPAHGGTPSEHAAEPSAHDAPAAHGAVASKADAATAPKGPAKLSAVHGRIKAALADVQAETNGRAKGHSAGGAPAGRRPAPAAPRYVVTWPSTRVHLAWADDTSRVVVAWPVPAVPAAPPVAAPVALPAASQPRMSAPSQRQ